MNRRPPMRRLLFLTVLGCQGKPQDEPKPIPPAAIQVRDGTTAIAELRPTRPCRGTVGPVELIVGGPPLVATFGATQWTGASGASGTTLSRDREAIARVYPVGAPAGAAVLDMNGVALVRIQVDGTTATVSNAAGVPFRKLTAAGTVIASDSPALTITGTSDLVLAALLSAPELQPELRILAACERVLVKDP